MVLNTNISPWYLNVNQILNGLKFIMVPGLLALALTVIVLQGEIDISLPSQVAVGTVLFGFLATQGVPYLLAVLIVIAVGRPAGCLQRHRGHQLRPALDGGHLRHAVGLPRAGLPAARR